MAAMFPTAELDHDELMTGPLIHERCRQDDGYERVVVYLPKFCEAFGVVGKARWWNEPYGDYTHVLTMVGDERFHFHWSWRELAKRLGLADPIRKVHVEPHGPWVHFVVGESHENAGDALTSSPESG